MGTQFTAIYNRFLGKITDDMYMELTPEDTIRDLRTLLIEALPKFEFCRKNLFDYSLETITIPEADVTLDDFVIGLIFSVYILANTKNFKAGIRKLLYALFNVDKVFLHIEFITLDEKTVLLISSFSSSSSSFSELLTSLFCIWSIIFCFRFIFLYIYLDSGITV